MARIFNLLLLVALPFVWLVNGLVFGIANSLQRFDNWLSSYIDELFDDP